MRPTVSAIVVAYAGQATLETCLKALTAALDGVPAPTELVLVLNRRTPDLRESVEAAWPEAILVEPSENLGFAGGVAAGLEHASGEWVALVNDDCVVSQDALARLLSAGRADERVGSVAAEVRFAREPDTINSAGIEVDELAVASERLLGANGSVAGTEPADVFGASGTFALYRRSMIDDIGGIDASFFAYLEDADLAWRARMRGWRCVFVPGAIAYHDHSHSLRHASAQKHFLVGRNRLRMIAKNATAALLRRRLASMIAYDVAYVLAACLRTHSLAALKGRLRGLRDWREYRRAGRDVRRAVDLAPPAGFRAALLRDRAYRAHSWRR